MSIKYGLKGEGRDTSKAEKARKLSKGSCVYHWLGGVVQSNCNICAVICLSIALFFQPPQMRSRTDTMYFRDGERRIDMVLAYEDDEEAEDEGCSSHMTS